MMTEQLGFSILTAPLAAIDRRALSQAWYSALHLAQGKCVQPSSAQPQTSIPSCDRAARVAEPHDHTRSVERDRHPKPRVPASKSPVAATPERRAERSALARHIERTFLNPIARPARATFTIDGTRVRVHVALQTTAEGVRIVAVCPASIRGRVSRALDEARYALATQGILLCADLSEA
jgi:hypothetical protein